MHIRPQSVYRSSGVTRGASAALNCKILRGGEAYAAVTRRIRQHSGGNFAVNSGKIQGFLLLVRILPPNSSEDQKKALTAI